MGVWRGRNGFYLAAFLMDLCLGLMSFAVPLVALRLGAGSLQLGFVGAGAFVYAATCVFSGRASEQLGRRASCALGALTAAAAGVSMTAARSIPWLFALQCCASFGQGLFWPPLQAWLAEQRDPRPLAGSLGRFNFAWSTGLTLGPLVAGLLAGKAVRLPLSVAAAGYVGVLLMVLLIAPGDRATEDADARPRPRREALSFLYIAWVCNFASWFMSVGVKVLFPELAQALAISKPTLGWLIAAIGLGQMAAFWGLGRGRWWQYRLWPIVGAQAVGMAAMMLLAVGRTTPVFLVGMLLAGGMTGMTYTASLFYSLRAPGAGRGVRTGMHEATLGVGILLGPLMGGWLADTTANLRTPYVLACAVIAATALAAAAGRALWRRRESEVLPVQTGRMPPPGE